MLPLKNGGILDFIFFNCKNFKLDPEIDTVGETTITKDASVERIVSITFVTMKSRLTTNKIYAVLKNVFQYSTKAYTTMA